MTKRPKAAERDDISYTEKEGWLLAHNSVRPTVDTRGGVNGFRRFWVPPDPNGSCATAAGGRTSGRTTPRSPRKRGSKPPSARGL